MAVPAVAAKGSGSAMAGPLESTAAARMAVPSEMLDADLNSAAFAVRDICVVMCVPVSQNNQPISRASAQPKDVAYQPRVLVDPVVSPDPLVVRKPNS
ncbi:MAG TPA: hypothetical protein VK437_00520 [Steroidobacteraceae bacterium]|nr:hypothetical protein [Steroidobacteraceae bacterium]